MSEARSRRASAAGHRRALCRCSGDPPDLRLAPLQLLGLVVELPVQAGEEPQDRVEQQGAPAQGQAGQGRADPAVAQVAHMPAGPHAQVGQPGQCHTPGERHERSALPEPPVEALTEHREAHHAEGEEQEHGEEVHRHLPSAARPPRAGSTLLHYPLRLGGHRRRSLD